MVTCMKCIYLSGVKCFHPMNIIHNNNDIAYWGKNHYRVGYTFKEIGEVNIDNNCGLYMISDMFNKGENNDNDIKF